jgi:hypothetical protein
MIAFNCTEHLAATIEALGLLGASCHQQVLREAGDLWLSRERQRIQIVEEYGKAGLEGEFETFDSRFFTLAHRRFSSVLRRT